MKCKDCPACKAVDNQENFYICVASATPYSIHNVDRDCHRFPFYRLKDIPSNDDKFYKLLYYIKKELLSAETVYNWSYSHLADEKKHYCLKKKIEYLERLLDYAKDL